VKYVRFLPLGLALVALAVAALLPASTLVDLRLNFPWFSHAINQMEGIFYRVDGTHVVMFAGVGLLVAWTLPRMRPRALAATGLAVVVLLAALSEVVQFWVPGRTPRLSDFGADLVGGIPGLAVGLMFRALVVGIVHWCRASTAPDGA